MESNELDRLRRENAALLAQLDADPYEIVEQLGSGGFCTTWRATRRVDDSHHIEICIKELKPRLREDPDCLRYFHREGRIASNLRHPNIPLLIDVDFPRFRLVYELIDGVDLRRLLIHAGGTLSPDLVILIGAEIADALEHAHSRTRADTPAGVLHRDLTPANILISADGHAVLADFGTAAIASTEAQTPQTSVRGTVEYMSPEQASRRPLDAGTDLFSLGVVLYELLAGKRPFDGDGADPASFERLCRGEYPPIEAAAPHTPPALAEIIRKLLQTKRKDRYETASDLFEALSAIAPQRTAQRSLGALSRAARKRKTKYDSKPELPHKVQFTLGPQPLKPLFVAPHSDTHVHEAVTVRRKPFEESEPARPAHVDREPTKRRVRARTLVAAISAPLLGALFVVGPTARSWSSDTAETAPITTASSQPPPTTAAPPKTEAPTPAAAAAATTVPNLPAQDNSTATPASVPANSAAPVAADPTDPSEATAPQPAAQAVLKVNADKSARVLVDGRYVGYSPLRVTVEPGSHKVVVGEGEHRKAVPVELSAGGSQEIFVKVRRPKK